jgi:hypothetical protein
VLDGDTVVQAWQADWKLTAILPGSTVTLTTSGSVGALATGVSYTMGIRVRNPLAGGPALRFGNAEQESNWLRLTP